MAVAELRGGRLARWCRYDAERGTIRIDGYYIADLDPVWLRQQIAIVEQNPLLLSGTVADNIRFGAPDASIDEVHDAARKAYAFDFVSQFPDGFDTMVGERGVLLSGGQQQRIAIARAILKQPRILLLDEATSALDTASERYVQAALRELMAGEVTTIQIAHRLSTIATSNQVAVLKGGRVAEAGSYAELTAADGLLHEMVAAQQL